MRERLIQYVELLFAGANDAGEIKQEILQNTLDRYDDLIDQGKSPDAAYRLAISGIGDINEILNSTCQPDSQTASDNQPVQPEVDSNRSKNLRAIAIALYILSIVPVLVFESNIGISLMFVIVAIATALIIIAGRSSRRNSHGDRRAAHYEISPQQQLRKSVGSVIRAIGLVTYFILSFATHAWHITWLIFPIIGAVEGLVFACMDLKEDK